MTGMMPGPDGNSAIPMQPTMLGDGDVMGDGIMGPPSEEAIKDPVTQETEGIEKQGEASIREQLVTEAYGTKLPQRRAVDKE